MEAAPSSCVKTSEDKRHPLHRRILFLNKADNQGLQNLIGPGGEGTDYSK